MIIESGTLIGFMPPGWEQSFKMKENAIPKSTKEVTKFEITLFKSNTIPLWQLC